ncbi:MAG: MFS transporter [Clostridia bacterium]|nr:MFS transporter [Clostridia bacterium]
MKKTVTPVTFHYMIITGAFWMSFCLISSYAAVYLQGAGYNNRELGLIMAAGSVGAALLSPLLGSWIDRNRRIRHAGVVYVLLIIQTALLLALRFNPARNVFSAVCYALYMTALLPVNAMNLDLCVRLEHARAPLNFGLARSMGSFAFVIISTLLGVLTERFSFLVLPWAGIVVVALQAAGNLLIDRDLRKYEASMPPEASSAVEKSASLAAFVRENPGFSIMLLGTILIYIAHNMDGNFLINLIENLGGGTAIMGYVAAFTAIVEVPVMMFSSRLPKRWSTADYIRLSFVFFVLKTLAYALAPNIPLFFAARTLQAPSYALYTVLIVSYADSVVARKDSAKAQSLAFAVTTVGSVLSSLLGGQLFDTMGVRNTMLTASGICAVGAAIAVYGTLRRNRGKA